MSKILVKEREIVVPGEVVAEGMDYLPAKGILREGERLIASQIGMINVEGRLVKLIPLTGSYSPKRNDLVIGKVVNITFSGWIVDIGHSNLSMLSLKDGSNDVIIAKITNVTKSNAIDLSMKWPGLMKLVGGIIIDIDPTKIPRVIGKQGSMISLIKTKTNCKIMAGQNGKIWIKGEEPKMELKVIEAINLVERESHIEGLTQIVEKFLEGK